MKEARQIVARVANEIHRRNVRRKATVKEKILEKLKQKAQRELKTKGQLLNMKEK